MLAENEALLQPLAVIKEMAEKIQASLTEHQRRRETKTQPGEHAINASIIWAEGVLSMVVILETRINENGEAMSNV